MATSSSILAWRIHWKESLVGYSPWGCKESYLTEQTRTCAHTHTLESVVYLHDHVTDWESWLTATAQHHHRVRYHISSTQGKIKIQKLKNDFSCFPALVK